MLSSDISLGITFFWRGRPLLTSGFANSVVRSADEGTRDALPEFNIYVRSGTEGVACLRVSHTFWKPTLVSFSLKLEIRASDPQLKQWDKYNISKN